MREELFPRYEELPRKADILFKTIHEKYPDSVRCRIRCCDCCHAVFGLFPMEAAYINYHFNRLDRKVRRDVMKRVEKAEGEMVKAKDRLQVFEDDENNGFNGDASHHLQGPPFSSDFSEVMSDDDVRSQAVAHFF